MDRRAVYEPIINLERGFCYDPAGNNLIRSAMELGVNTDNTSPLSKVRSLHSWSWYWWSTVDTIASRSLCTSFTTSYRLIAILGLKKRRVGNPGISSCSCHLRPFILNIKSTLIFYFWRVWCVGNLQMLRQHESPDITRLQFDTPAAVDWPNPETLDPASLRIIQISPLRIAFLCWSERLL